MGVSRSRATSVRPRMAAVLAVQHMADLLLTARRWCAMNISSDSITNTQQLALFTMPEPLSSLPITPRVVTTTTHGGHTTISIQHISIITLASLLALQCALKWKWEAGAGSRTGCATYFIMGICWTGVIWNDKSTMTMVENISIFQLHEIVF